MWGGVGALIGGSIGAGIAIALGDTLFDFPEQPEEIDLWWIKLTKSRNAFQSRLLAFLDKISEIRLEQSFQGF